MGFFSVLAALLETERERRPSRGVRNQPDARGQWMKIGMQNLAYNLRRFVTLERMTAAP